MAIAYTSVCVFLVVFNFGVLQTDALYDISEGKSNFSIISQVSGRFVVSDSSLVSVYEKQNISTSLIERVIYIKRNNGVCQIRLDFLEMSLARPASSLNGRDSGNCLTEHLTVSGSATLTTPLQVCGYMTGQHMYLTFRQDNPISLTLATLPLSRFIIGITEISCNATSACSDSCLQYYDGEQGVITSFNAQQGASLLQLNNQKYQICLKRVPGKSTITLSSCGSLQFFVSGSNSPVIALEESDCPIDKDYVVISGRRYCGNNFLPLTQPMSNEMSVFVHFNEDETNDKVRFPFGSVVTAAQCQILSENNGLTNCIREYRENNYFCSCDQTYGNITIPSTTWPSSQDHYCKTLPIMPGYQKCTWVVAANNSTTTNHCFCQRILLRDVDNRGFCLTYAQT